MPGKRQKPEEIVTKLRQADVLISHRKPLEDAVRAIRVTEVAYYRWRQEAGCNSASKPDPTTVKYPKYNQYVTIKAQRRSASRPPPIDTGATMG